MAGQGASRASTVRQVLAKEDATLLAAVEHTDDAIEITDAQGRIQWVNRAFERLTGYSREEALGQTPAALFRAGQHDVSFYDAIWKTITLGQVWRGRLVGRRRDGSFYQQDATISPVRDTAGEITHFVAIKRDLSALLRALEAEAATQRDFRRMVLAASAGQEMHAPLTSVVDNLAFLAAELPAVLGDVTVGRRQELLACVEATRAGAERIRSIVKDLRGLARSESAGRHVVDLRQIVETALPTVSAELRDRARLVRDFRPVPPVMARSGSLVQVVTNLLANAAHALPEGHADQHAIHVSTRTDETGRAVLEVRDSGPKLASGMAGRIFDPFATSHVGGAKGHPLSIAHAIVTEHGGEITVDDAPDGGTSVRVALPPAPPREASSSTGSFPALRDPAPPDAPGPGALQRQKTR